MAFSLYVINHLSSQFFWCPRVPSIVLAPATLLINTDCSTTASRVYLFIVPLNTPKCSQIPLSPGSGHDPAQLRAIKRWTKRIRTYKAVSGRKHLGLGKVLGWAGIGLGQPGPLLSPRSASAVASRGRWGPSPPPPTPLPPTSNLSANATRRPSRPSLPSSPQCPPPSLGSRASPAPGARGRRPNTPPTHLWPQQLRRCLR